jgi:glucose dehydrogenase
MDPATSAPVWHDYLFAGTHGHVVALDKAAGTEVWRTSLPSTGFSVVAIVIEDGRLFCASGGHTFALDPTSGEILWRNDMPSLGNGVVFLATARSNASEALLAVLAQASNDQAAAAGGASAAV